MAIAKILTFRTTIILSFAMLFFILQPALADDSRGDKWEIEASITPWAASIGGETATGSDIDITLSDIIENLDFTFMGHIGARKNKWSFFVDVIYLDIEDDDEVEGRTLALTDLEMTSWILTPSVGYTFLDSGRWYMDFIVGARYLYLKVDVELETMPPLPNVRSDDSESGGIWDGIVGVRGKVDLNRNWYIPFYMDVGTGDSDLTWQVYAGVAYKFESFTLDVGYRYLAWNWDDDDQGGAVFNDLDVSGPMIGFKFIF